MIFHSENYGCQIGTGACRNLCPVQIHPGGFPAALENQILCGFRTQKSGTATKSPQTGTGNLIPSFCQKWAASVVACRCCPYFYFISLVNQHRWRYDIVYKKVSLTSRFLTSTLVDTPKNAIEGHWDKIILDKSRASPVDCFSPGIAPATP